MISCAHRRLNQVVTYSVGSKNKKPATRGVAGRGWLRFLRSTRGACDTFSKHGALASRQPLTLPSGNRAPLRPCCSERVLALLIRSFPDEKTPTQLGKRSWNF